MEKKEGKSRRGGSNEEKETEKDEMEGEEGKRRRS